MAAMTSRLAAVIGVVLVASASMQVIRVAPQLKTGDRFELAVTVVKQNSARPQQSGKSTTPVDVRVVSAVANGFELEWVAGEGRIEGGQAVDPVVRAAATALRGLKLRLTLDADGAYTGLANQNEVLSQVQKGVDLVVGAVIEKLPAEQRATMQKVLAQMLSPALLIQSATREAQIYFGMSGAELSVGESAALSLQQPSPFGGGSLPATFSVTMTSATSDAVVLTTATTYDPDALMRMTRALLEQSGKPIPEAELAKAPPLTLNDEGRYVLDRKLGLPRELVVNRQISAGPDQRLERWEIRLVRAPQR